MAWNFSPCDWEVRKVVIGPWQVCGWALEIPICVYRTPPDFLGEEKTCAIFCCHPCNEPEVQNAASLHHRVAPFNVTFDFLPTVDVPDAFEETLQDQFTSASFFLTIRLSRPPVSRWGAVPSNDLRKERNEVRWKKSSGPAYHIVPLQDSWDLGALLEERARKISWRRMQPIIWNEFYYSCSTHANSLIFKATFPSRPQCGSPGQAIKDVATWRGVISHWRCFRCAGTTPWRLWRHWAT